MKIIYENKLTEDFYGGYETEDIKDIEKIVLDLKKQGDEALLNYTKRFDGVKIKNIRVEKTEIKNAYNAMDGEVLENLRRAAENIKSFAQKQKEQCRDFEYEVQPGVFAGQKVIPISQVGIYVPGGNFPLPSTVLMCAIPAKTAGADRVVLCSPPTYNGSIHPAILAAAEIAEVDGIYKIGGAQAVAAMAYGTETVKPVDIIAGPGNKYVTAAKKYVYGRVGIDFLAGPSEILIIADESADPSVAAADLLAQAEHDINAVPVLITDSEELAEKVKNEVPLQLKTLTTAETAKESMRNNGKIIITSSLEKAVEIANKKAPEHLELLVADPDRYRDKCRNYGSLFIGKNSAEVLGDYSSGLNHTLPTSGNARFTGGLSVMNFLKFQTTLRVNDEGLKKIGPAAEKLSKLEGLEGHFRSVNKRMRMIE